MIGIAEALTFEEGGEEDGDMPAGDAIDVGNMKSSMFMASGSGVFETSTDSRSLAIPEGALVGCWLALQMRLSVQTLGAHVRSSECQTYRACSRSLRFRFMAIILQVRFSIRS